MSAPRVTRLGYFGKVPAAGDFVSRNVDRKVKEAFDGWLQAAMEQSRSILGDGWTPSFLSAPVWRFLSAGLGETDKLVAGVMIPSVDRVGRYFPFAILAELDGLETSARGLSSCDGILSILEPLALSALEEEFDLDYLEYQLSATAKKMAGGGNIMEGAKLGHIADADKLDKRLAQLDWTQASVWWTEGSDFRQADLVLYQGMPPVGSFAAMLRDPDIFRDLDAIWDEIRHLGAMQNDNASIEAGVPSGAWRMHAITHPGKAGGRNAGFVELGKRNDALFISDGRFGATHHAMASRFLSRAIPTAWAAGSGALAAEELERIIAYLRGKVGAQQSNLLPVLSFAYAVADRENESRMQVLCAGDYLCLHKGRDTIMRLFAKQGQQGENAPTVRYGPHGLYAAVALDMEAGDRIFLASSIFASPALSGRIVQGLQAADVSDAAHATLQEPLIRGLNGPVSLGIVDRVAKDRPA